MKNLVEKILYNEQPYRCQRTVSWWMLHPRTQFFVAFLIFANFFVSVWFYQVRPEKGSNEDELYRFMEKIFACFFGIEILLTVYGLGLTRYFTNIWNIFDLIIVIISIMAIPYQAQSGISVLRLFRAFRTVRFFKRVPILKRVIDGILASMLGIFNGLIICFFFMSVWSIIGVYLFPEYEEHFGDYTRALFTMFQIMTFDSWASNIGRDIIFEGNRPEAYVFFLSYIYVVGIIVFNVVISTLLEKYLGTERTDVCIISNQLYGMCKDDLIEVYMDVMHSNDLENVPKRELSWIAQNLWRCDGLGEVMKDLVKNSSVLDAIPKKSRRSLLLDLLLHTERRKEADENYLEMFAAVIPPILQKLSRRRLLLKVPSLKKIRRQKMLRMSSLDDIQTRNESPSISRNSRSRRHEKKKRRGSISEREKKHKGQGRSLSLHNRYMEPEREQELIYHHKLKSRV